MNWILLTQDKSSWRAVVNTVMKVEVPWNEGNFLMTSWEPDSFWGRILLNAVSELLYNLSESCSGNAGLRHRCGVMSVRYEQHFTGICKQFWLSLVEWSVPTWRCVCVCVFKLCGMWRVRIRDCAVCDRNRGEILK